MIFDSTTVKLNSTRSLKTILTFIVLLCTVRGFSQKLPSEVKQGSSTKSAIISFKWDDDEIDWEFMNNSYTKKEAERLFTNHIVMTQSDSIVISASASPEGEYNYNQRLSQRRLNSVLTYIKSNYPLLKEGKIRVHSKGPDWQGLYDIILKDTNVPSRDHLLSLINSNISPNEKAKLIKTIDSGVPYEYMQKHIFHKLRTSTALVLFYPTNIEHIVEDKVIVDTISEPIIVEPCVEEVKPESQILPSKEVSYRFIRPIAIKTNMLFDLATLFNIEVEVPIKKQFSVLAEWTFPFWGGLGNRGGVAPLPAYSEDYTLQMLSGSLEFRYWFKRAPKLDKKAQKWGDYNPLNGWFVGVYGGSGLYDFQYNKKGMQGEFFVNAGITGGYTHPIGKHLHMEYSLGVGYVSTQYYKYTGDSGRKVVNVRPDGTYDRRKQAYFGPTKAKISLVWIPQFKVKNRK